MRLYIRKNGNDGRMLDGVGDSSKEKTDSTRIGITFGHSEIRDREYNGHSEIEDERIRRTFANQTLQ